MKERLFVIAIHKVERFADDQVVAIRFLLARHPLPLASRFGHHVIEPFPLATSDEKRWVVVVGM